MIFEKVKKEWEMRITGKIQIKGITGPQYIFLKHLLKQAEVNKFPYEKNMVSPSALHHLSSLTKDEAMIHITNLLDARSNRWQAKKKAA